MALTQAKSIYANKSGDLAYLRNIIVGVFENAGAKTVAGKLKSKNANLSVPAGSYEFKRYANAESKEYGSARCNPAGANKLVAKPITVNLDQDKEIVETINEFDANSFTDEAFESFLKRRQYDIQLALERELDREFFATAKAEGTSAGITIDASGNIVEQLETVILKLVTTKNEFVDGVDRENMALVVSPRLHSKLKTELNHVYNFSGTVESGPVPGINGVAVMEALRLPEGTDYVLLTKDSIAQPVSIKDAKVDVWPASVDVYFGTFYRYGTRVLAPELVLHGSATF